MHSSTAVAFQYTNYLAFNWYIEWCVELCGIEYVLARLFEKFGVCFANMECGLELI